MSRPEHEKHHMLYLALEVAWADYQNHPEYRASRDQAVKECAKIDAEIKRLQGLKQDALDLHTDRIQSNEILKKFKAEHVYPIKDAKEAEDEKLLECGEASSVHTLDYLAWDWACGHGYIEPIVTDAAHPVTDKGRAAVAKYEAENDR